MREMVDIDEEISAHKRTLEELHQQVIRGEEIVRTHAIGLYIIYNRYYLQSDILDRYENDVKGKIDKYMKKTTRQKYGRNQHYADFRQAIHVRGLLLFIFTTLYVCTGGAKSGRCDAASCRIFASRFVRIIF